MKNRTKKHHLTVLSAMAASAMAISSSQAAITFVDSIQYNDNADRTISLKTGAAEVTATYGGTGSGFTASAVSMSLGAVTDYRLYAGTTTGYYALNASSRIGAYTTTATAANNSNANFWVNEAGTRSAFGNFATTLGAASVSGTIDVTGLSSGILYFLVGSGTSADGRATNLRIAQGGAISSNLVDFTGVASGDQIARGSAYNAITGTSYWAGNTDTIAEVVKINFTNNGSQNTINWSYSGSSGGRFSGVVLSAVPEPSAALLGGLGFLALLRRRRA